MTENFELILNKYNEAYKENFTNHPIARVIRKTIPEKIVNFLNKEPRYIVYGSAGQGNWTIIPWIAIFDRLITTSAQSGYYPVFLFKDDMSGFYFSLNQGITEIKKEYKRDAKQVLKIKAEDYRARIGKIPKNFSEISIKLKVSNPRSNLASFYEAGNIIAKYYKADSWDEEVLFKDILEMIKIYDALSYNDTIAPTDIESEYEESKFLGYENLQRFRFHKRIERNTQLAKKVKSIQGYTCKACRINFEEIYGEIGKKFIEAHHLTPITKLQGNKILLDVRTDFTVLCSNCHSMIHKLKDPSDLELLIDILKHNNLRW